MKSGFTLIEFIIGLLLFSIIATALYNSFFVTNRVVRTADTFISKDFKSALIENQLAKDLEGAFIPPEPEQPTEQKKPQPEANKEQPKAENKPPKPLEKVFYSVNGAHDSLSVLTFISNNPIKTYEKEAKPQPRIVRIVYRVVPQEGAANEFKLLRQESTELDFKAFDLAALKPIRAYELATGIKDIKLEFTYPVQKEQKEQSNNQPKSPLAAPKTTEQGKEQKPEYKTAKNWDLEANKETHKEQPKIPHFITMTGTFRDTQQPRESSFIFQYEIPTFSAATMPKKSKKSVATQAPAQPKNQGQAQQAAPTKPVQPANQQQPTLPQPAAPAQPTQQPQTLADLAKMSAQLLGNKG